ncbi:MAG: HEAT repeat domain-containing protein [Balneolales bacterium]|nr:HEAT repeat domain-containing protein [Balneolales bacterium]
MILLISDSFALQFIATTTLVLLLITLYLLASSVLVRNAHLREKHYQETKKEIYYPLILAYMVHEDDNLDELRSYIETEDDILPLLLILYEIMDSVEGDEIERLRDMLALELIRKYQFRMLSSTHYVKRMDACAYYARMGRLTEDEFNRVSVFLTDKMLMLAHASATAVMSSKDVNHRKTALKSILLRQRISRLAILDLIYQFHNNESDQMDEEAAILLELIEDRTFPHDNISMLIKSACEIGYITLAMDLVAMLENGYWDDSALITEALIYAMGRFSLGFTSEVLIEKYLTDPRPNVRRAVAATLESFDEAEHAEHFYTLAKDVEFAVRLKAIYALAGLGDAGSVYLRQLSAETSEMRNLIRGVVAEVEGA